ncbi:hypothetical protein B0J14DRAFT_707667 [Halenospora varia]|nr:hypothetical protein B0J14DRAFT_707667 [Halenospora varia]
MYFTTPLAIFSLLALTSATPITTTATGPTSSVPLDDSMIIAGPLPFANLTTVVNNLHSNTTVDKRAINVGLYMCANANFKGQCYYGMYPISVGIKPDPYWQARISSVGPDKDVQCFFYSKGCISGVIQAFSYPGGNLRAGLNNHLKCFYCNPE